jgi:hypothetical protein
VCWLSATSRRLARCASLPPAAPRDLTDAELRALHGHMARWPLLLVQSGADESVPDPAGIPELGRRLIGAAASGGGGGVVRRHVVIEGAPHNAAGHEEELARHVADFLGALEAGPM